MIVPMRAPNSKLATRRPNLPAYAGLVRWAFARFYREFAWTYDSVAAAVSGGHWAEWATACLPYLRGQVLELGCGTGNLQLALARQQTTRAIGVDASPQMLAIAQHKLARAALPSSLVRGAAQTLPFAAASFDTVVATFPSEYILDPATLAEIGRVLRADGQLVVVLAASFADDGLYQRAIDLLYRLTLQRSPRVAPEHAPQSTLGQRLMEQRFAVDERWLPVAGSHVHLLVGERV